MTPDRQHQEFGESLWGCPRGSHRKPGGQGLGPHPTREDPACSPYPPQPTRTMKRHPRVIPRGTHPTHPHLGAFIHLPTPMGLYLSSPLGAGLPSALPPGLGNFLETRHHENQHLLTAFGQRECVGVFISIFIFFFFFHKIQQHMVGVGRGSPREERSGFMRSDTQKRNVF